MKKILIVLFSAGLFLFSSLPVNAALIFSPDLATIQGMSKTWDAANTTSSNFTSVNVGSAIRFVSSMKYGDGMSDGWASMGVGYGWPPPAPLNNLSGYTGYSLTFLNTNESIWFVNLYMNTGWTDPPYSEQNNFYESTWVELLPNVSTTITLDFAGAVNLNHVTNIGFQVGANMDAYPQNNLSNPSNPDDYHIDVSPIPEPATLLMLGLGSLLLIRRKK